MRLLRNTKKHKKFWAQRKIDWKKEYFDTYNHPHRKILVSILKSLPWMSLMEIGCAAGANLAAIINNIPGKQVGGIDISADAIEKAREMFEYGFFKVNSADDIMMSDKSTDIVLSDMTLIYVSKKDIGRYIKEIKRIARNYILLCEFHSDSWWNRMSLKINSGYNAYDWKKILNKYGLKDIVLYKLKEEDWPGGNPQKTFGYIILARVPKY